MISLEPSFTTNLTDVARVVSAYFVQLLALFNPTNRDFVLV